MGVLVQSNIGARLLGEVGILKGAERDLVQRCKLVREVYVAVHVRVGVNGCGVRAENEMVGRNGSVDVL